MKPFLIIAIYALAVVGMGRLAIALIGRLLNRSVAIGRTLNDFGVDIQFALGSALISAVWLAFGLTGALRSGVVWMILVPCFLVGAQEVLQKWRGGHYPGIRRNIWNAPIVLGVVAAMAWFAILAYLRPPFGDADALYMTYPKVISATGELLPMVGTFRDFSSNGLSGELHFAALMAISTPAVAKLFAWVTGMATLALLVGVTRRMGGGEVAQGAAVLILLTSSTFADYLTDGKVDLFAALLGMGALYCVLAARGSSSPLAFISAAGLLLGFSLTAKFSYIVALLPAIVLLSILRESDEDAPLFTQHHFHRSFRVLVLLGATMLMGVLPHLLKNYYLFGHALAPFFGMQSNWADQSPWYAAKDTLWIVLTYPVALVFGLYPLMGGNISFLWLATMPLLLFLPREQWRLNTPLMQVSLSALVGVLCWLAVKASIFAPRYILATLAALIPLPAIALEHVLRKESHPRLIAFGFFILSLVALATIVYTPPAGVWTAVPGSVLAHIKNGRPECGLSISSYCTAFNALNAQARQGDRVFVAGYYTYWLRPDLLQCMNQMEEAKLLNAKSAEEAWIALFRHGFAHVAVQKASHGEYLQLLNPSAAPHWLNVSVEFSDSDMPIYHLKYSGVVSPPEIACLRSGRTAWKPTLRQSMDKS